MANLNGFWSYVHKDDEADGGRLSQLARDLVSQFEMLTGETITLFLDKDDIEWGETWKNKIDTNLANVGFFVPVLTPRYFLSPECRRELNYVANLAAPSGLNGLILPILYVDVKGLYDKDPTDELIQLINTFQRVDWRELRFHEVNSEGYRRGVAQLATSLAEANKRAEEVSITVTHQESNLAVEGLDEEPGIVEVMADFEEKLNKSPETLNQLNVEITTIGKLMMEATADMKKNLPQNLVFANRLIVTRRLADQLHEPIERIWTLSNELSAQLHSIDRGYRIMVEQAPSAIENDPSAREIYCKMFDSIRSFDSNWDTALNSVQEFMTATEPLNRLSRDLRPGLRRLGEGLTIMLELRGLSREWLNLLETSGINCDDIKIQN